MRNKITHQHYHLWTRWKSHPPANHGKCRFGTYHQLRRNSVHCQPCQEGRCTTSPQEESSPRLPEGLGETRSIFPAAARKAETLAQEARAGKKAAATKKRRMMATSKASFKAQGKAFYAETSKQGSVCEDGFNP